MWSKQAARGQSRAPEAHTLDILYPDREHPALPVIIFSRRLRWLSHDLVEACIELFTYLPLGVLSELIIATSAQGWGDMVSPHSGNCDEEEEDEGSPGMQSRTLVAIK